MTWIILPEWNTNSIILYIFLVILCVAFWLLERFELLKLNYSKFRKPQGISSRVGMFILYFVPIIMHVLGARSYVLEPSLIQLILLGAICIHFAKRCLEVLFLHKYAGPIDMLTVLQITASYSFATYFLGFLHSTTIAEVDALFLVGALLYVFGQYLNFYHHKLLADLREHNSGYFIPRGGLFRYVSAPHYLMELCVWFGIALMSRHLGSFLIFCWTFGYLSARSLKTHVWYRQRFSDYPETRKALLPFLL